MRQPFQFIQHSKRNYIFWSLFGVSLVLITAFGIIGAPLNTEAAPYGIVSFEIAGSVPNTEKIMDSWDAITRERAAFSLGLDFLFIPAYSIAIALGCAMAGDALRRRSWPLVSLSNYMAWGVVSAGFLDIVENIALTTILFGSVVAPWPQIAAACAILKFVLVFFALVYVLLGAVVTLIKPQSRNNDD